MASLKCSKCGFGIHCNSESCGIEYIYISVDDWKEICGYRFDPNHKVYDETGKYPKLFRTDTIEEDFKEKINKLWVCPECKTIHQFDSTGSVISWYTICENDAIEECNQAYLCFSDSAWNELIDKSLSDDELSCDNATYYAKASENFIYVYNDMNCSRLVLIFHKN